MAKRIRKAVIPAAGLGTRFLPATKSVPKELLPIVDRPGLLYVVDEAVAAGVDEIILITSQSKRAIEKLFEPNPELEEFLKAKKQTELLKIVQDLSSLVKITPVIQHNPHGLGHAVACAKEAVGDEPFLVLLGDEITVGSPSVSQQMAQVFERTQKSVIAVMEVPLEETKKYGIADVIPLEKNVYTVKGVVEKPDPSAAPSRWALPGRYLFTPKIFDHLAKVRPGKNGEIQLTDAIETLAKSEGLLAMSFTNRRFDAGDKFGFLKANVELALDHSELGLPFRKYLKELAARL